MKKFLFVSLLTLVLVGCKNEVKCSLEKEENEMTLQNSAAKALRL